MEAKDKELLFSIIKAGMLNEKIDLSSLNEDSDLFRIIKEQTFHPFLYYISKDNRFKKYFLSSYLLVEQFDKLALLIKSLFDKEGIDHIFLKGYELRKLYSNPALRLSGDLDVIVRVEDYERAKKVLEDNKFVFENEQEHHAGFSCNNLEIELHRYLMQSNIDFFDYFLTPFDKAENINGHTFKLNIAFNFCYIIAHYIKHLRGGAGLRELCDLYVMLEKLDVNMDEVNVFLKKYKLEKFFNTVLGELNILFGFNKLTYTKDNYAIQLIDYSLQSGIHGFGEDNNQMITRHQTKKESKFVFLLKRWFIPIKDMFKRYPWTKSIILIPIGYIVRFFHLLFTQFGLLKKTLNDDNKVSDLFKNIGLKD